MGILALKADERVAGVGLLSDSLSFTLKDGRVISVPLTWCPKLLHAAPEQLNNWKSAGGGYGIYWPNLDEDLSTEGRLRGTPAPRHPAPPCDIRDSWRAVCDRVFATPFVSSSSGPERPAPFWQSCSCVKDILSGAATVTRLVRGAF